MLAIPAVLRAAAGHRPGHAGRIGAAGGARRPRRGVAGREGRPRPPRLRRPDPTRRRDRAALTPRWSPTCAPGSASCCSTSTRTPRSRSASCCSGCSATAIRSWRSVIRARRSTAGGGRASTTSRASPSTSPRSDPTARWTARLRDSCCRRTVGPGLASSRSPTARRPRLRAVHTGVEPLRPATTARVPGSVTCALFDTYSQEVAWLVQQIEATHAARSGEQVAWRQIAVLAATGRDLVAVDTALRRRGVPTQLVGAAALLAQPAVIDLRSLLEVLHDPTANPAFVRLAAGPRWRIGARDLAALGDRAAQPGWWSASSRRAGHRRRPRRGGVRQRRRRLGLADRGPRTTSVTRTAYSAAAHERFAEMADEVNRLRGSWRRAAARVPAARAARDGARGRGGTGAARDRRPAAACAGCLRRPRGRRSATSTVASRSAPSCRGCATPSGSTSISHSTSPDRPMRCSC